MVTNIINIVGFLLSILYSGENTANIGFTFGTGTKACRIRKKSLQKLDGNNFLSVIVDRGSRKHSHILQTTHVIQIALSKGHKETNSLYSRNCLGKRLDFLVMKKIHILIANLVKIIFPLNGHRRNFHPMSILPVASRSAYLTKVDLRVKVGCKCIPMVSSVAVQNINGINLVKLML